MRVTLGIATFDRETYLADSIASALAQDYEDFELLVVDDGSTNPRVAEVLASVQDRRMRVVRHSENRGISAAYNTMIAEGRGELIAMVGDDDVCLPGRLRRQVEIFDEHPETGVVHGDAVVIDASSQAVGRWQSRDFTAGQLLKAFVRSHNHLVDPTRMVHRRVYETVGGYDPGYRLAQDMHFWLRAAREFRFRHCPGGPLVGFRRHGKNTSDESARELEVQEVERALREMFEATELRELVPELDWSVLDPIDAERQALMRLADLLTARLLPLPQLGESLRERAAALPQPATRNRTRHGGHARDAPGHERRLVMTAFGWNDSGGGTTVPRLAAKELARRGWEVTVFHAATGATDQARPYEVVESDSDGVRLLGVHNRRHGLWDLANPLRELDDPPITAAFAQALERFKPQAVHFHNLHNLGAALIDVAATRGLRSFFTTHNYWLICPRAYLLTGEGSMCPGPGDGRRCSSCVQSLEPAAHALRLSGIRARAMRGLGVCLTVSEAVRRTLIGAGYPPEMLDVVRQGMPHDQEIWQRLGRERRPGRLGERLTVGFVGSAYPHKGPQLLVQAAQRTQTQIRVQIHGEVPETFARHLAELDGRGVVELCGAFDPSELTRVLAGVDIAALPSLWWDCAPLAAAECLAGRVPLLAPRLGGLGESIADGLDGLLFDGLDPADLARCIDRVACEPGLLEDLQAGIRPPRAFTEYIDELEAYYAGERPGRVEHEAAIPRSARHETLVTDGVSVSPNVTDRRLPAVRWQGDHGLATSLSIVNGRVTERLSARVQRVERDGRAVDPPLPHAADVEVRHQWPPDLALAASGRLAVIQPWEFGAIPREWVAALRERVDEVWVPSEIVRTAYLRAGLEAERVVVIPNGVDLQRFSPEGELYALPEGVPARRDATRFLFVGGLIRRKGPDVLLAAWSEAFAGREDVVLVVKDFGESGIYRGADRDGIRAYAAAGRLPRVALIGDELTDEEMAALYRSCDVLVHPYRGEGFGMPVLEAMACGLPTIVTGGGATDEFCPPQAGWRIRSARRDFPEERVDRYETVGVPWMLEPDVEHLVALLREVQSTPAERARRGAAARIAAQGYGWDGVAKTYDARLQRLANGPSPRALASRELEDQVALRVLAAPAWRGEDRLAELLQVWCEQTEAMTDACLYLLADPVVDGTREELEQRLMGCGCDFETSADVTVLMQRPEGEEDRRLHEAMDVFVGLHCANSGHERMAAQAHSAIVTSSEGLRQALACPGSREQTAARAETTVA